MLADFNSLGVLAEAHKIYDQLSVNPDIRAKLAEEGKTMDGGFIYVAHEDAGMLLHASLLCSTANITARRGFSEEKVLRLFLHADHTLSRQSANKAEQKYPGAVRVGKFGLGFSGLPGHLDELFMLILAVRLRLATSDYARRVLTEFPNDYATEVVINQFFP